VIDEGDFMFDPDQYNFIINRHNCFTCDNFVGNDFEKLSFILQKMEQVDPVLLQQLHYFYEDPLKIDEDGKIDLFNESFTNTKVNEDEPEE
jgi:hypothetical protein